ncbi:hypothetical protein MTO96_026818 [Rhipicephalus appendiculatus]
METPLPFNGDSLGRTKEDSCVTARTPTQQELDKRGRLVSGEVRSCSECPERTTARCSAIPELDYVAFIAVHRAPMLFSRHDAARKSNQPDSKGRPAYYGRTTERAALCRCPSGRTGCNRQRWWPCFFSVTRSGTSTRLLQPATIILEQGLPEGGTVPAVVPPSSAASAKASTEVRSSRCKYCASITSW